MENKVTKVCPGCGAALPDTRTAVCPYCGRELIDLSRLHTDQKIAEVKKVQSETMAVPKKIGLIVAATLFVLFLVFMLVIILDVPGKMKEAGMEREMDHLSRDMKEAYEDGDWDKLEQYLILECEDYISAPDYFLYRTAWYLHTFPTEFDDAASSNDTAKMLEIYEILAEDYNMRSDGIFFQIYETDETIENALKEEVEREKAILTEEGLEDEMYKLRG